MAAMAREKFWETPELVEKLLPFLDPDSTLTLARCYKKVPGILQGTCIWNQFIRRACPFTDEGNALQRRRQVNIDLVRCFVAILKLMKNPDDLQQDLLELICENFPPQEGKTILHMGCSSHQEGHGITLEGLVLVDEVQRTFGSSALKIESINSFDYWYDWVWSALSGTLSRCEQMMSSVRIQHITINNVGSMNAFRTVLQFCPVASTYLERIDVDVDNLAMAREFRNLLLACPQPRDPVDIIVNSRQGHGDIGYEGWEFLAKAVQLRPGFVEKIICCPHVLQEAKMEDMRVIWEVIGDVELGHELHDWRENFKRRDGEKAWNRLVRIIEMTEEDLKRDIEDKEECDVCLSE